MTPIWVLGGAIDAESGFWAVRSGFWSRPSGFWARKTQTDLGFGRALAAVSAKFRCSRPINTALSSSYAQWHTPCCSGLPMLQTERTRLTAGNPFRTPKTRIRPQRSRIRPRKSPIRTRKSPSGREVTRIRTFLDQWPGAFLPTTGVGASPRYTNPELQKEIHQ